MVRLFIAVCFVVFTSCSDSGSGPSCPTPHVVSVDRETLVLTGTCAPEELSEDVDVTTEGTHIIVGYQTQAIVCDGEFVIDIEPDGNRVSVVETVEGPTGECGCTAKFDVSLGIELCEPGSFVVLINGVEHTVSL